MSKIYEVRGEGDSGPIAYGARHTYEDAEHLLADTRKRVHEVGGRVNRYWIEEIDTTGLFTMPSRPTPRERFRTRVTVISASRTWEQVHVQVVEGDHLVAEYDRNYRMLQTFEPFRQGDRDFALISTNYTASTVVDLDTGEMIASEEPHPTGFCPVGFYVPDWWDVHDGRTLPGSSHWKADHEWPSAGDFGFVWGCIWGDDSSWKVQYLDLSRVTEGVIRRDERFGLLKLAARPDVPAREFIRCWSSGGRRRVEFHVEQDYDLETGERTDLDPWA